MHSIRTYLLQALTDPAAGSTASTQALEGAEIGDAIGQQAQQRGPSS
jgi:hypothetical protein